MPIRVTCPNPKCLKKFQVSEQFAGKKGPCPACKKEITIPDPKKEGVKIHAADTDVPVDSKGRSVLKPVFRKDASISTMQIVAIIGLVVVYFATAFIIRSAVGADIEAPVKDFPFWPLILGAIAIGPPMAFAGYYFLKEEEIAMYQGQELWIRVFACGAIFALVWLAPIGTAYAWQGNYETVPLVIAVAVMFAVGGAAGMASFEMEYLNGLMLFALYFGVCVLMRVIINAGSLPLEAAAAAT